MRDIQKYIFTIKQFKDSHIEADNKNAYVRSLQVRIIFINEINYLANITNKFRKPRRNNKCFFITTTSKTAKEENPLLNRKSYPTLQDSVERKDPTDSLFFYNHPHLRSSKIYNNLALDIGDYSKYNSFSFLKKLLS